MAIIIIIVTLANITVLKEGGFRVNGGIESLDSLKRAVTRVRKCADSWAQLDSRYIFSNRGTINHGTINTGFGVASVFEAVLGS